MFVRLLLALALAGCGAEPPPSADGQEHATGFRADLDAALIAYEDVRARLAADQFDAVPEAAKRLEQAAKKAAGSAPESLRGDIEAVSAASTTLAAAPAGDGDAQRAGFGEVSKALLASMGKDSELTAGLHVYECPMTAGYKKWIAREEGISNPYKGRRMLTCGMASDWTP